MRQPKFKYYFQQEETGRITAVIFTVCELAAGCLSEYLKSNPRWHVFDRAEGTGLTDKNGVEIFEGDTIRDEFGRISEVIWKDGKGLNSLEAAWWLFQDKSSNWLMHECKIKDMKMEVIGNIYENPELLEGE